MNPQVVIQFNDKIIPNVHIFFKASSEDIDNIWLLKDKLDELGWIIIGAFNHYTGKEYIEFDKWIDSIGSIECEYQVDLKPCSFHATKIDPTLKSIDFNKQVDEIYMFHVTDRSNIESILKKGLLPKSSNKTEFKYAPCVHLLRSLGGEIVKLVNNKLLVEESLELSDPILLKIGPMNDLDLNLFIDPSAYYEGVICTERIDPYIISVVDPKDYETEFKDYEYKKSNKIATVII